MGPWLVGMILGFIFYKIGNEKVKISNTVDSTLWILAISVITSIVVIMQPFNEPFNNQTTLVANANMLAFHRLLWAISLAWIVFACQNLKSGGIIRWFLSLPEWQPVGRMGLSIYLVHPLYQLTTMINQKQTFYFEIWPMVS
jgi:hypothetical protein